eukprot:jgi/Bigna1/70299/fgenesh1_pg.11_\
MMCRHSVVTTVLSPLLVLFLITAPVIYADDEFDTCSAEEACESEVRVPKCPPTVGTKKLYEDDSSVVWDFVLPAGERLPPHEHMYDYRFTVIEGSRLAATSAETGEELFQFDAPTGATMAFVRKGELMHDTSGAIPAFDSTHGVKNVGNTTYREIIFETKPCETGLGDGRSAQRYDSERVRRVQLYEFQEEKQSGAVQILLNHAKILESRAGGRATSLFGSCANAAVEKKLAKEKTHAMVTDFESVIQMRETMEDSQVVSDLSAIPSIVFDFHPNLVKLAKRNGAGSLKHVVFIKFKTESPVGDLIAGYIDLPNHIDQMKGFEWGPFANGFNTNGPGSDIEAETRGGFEYVFITTFDTATDRDAYLVHNAHEKYVKQLVPNVEDFMVMDFVAFAN